MVNAWTGAGDYVYVAVCDCSLWSLFVVKGAIVLASGERVTLPVRWALHCQDSVLKLGPLVNARVAWMVMESPSFYVGLAWCARVACVDAIVMTVSLAAQLVYARRPEPHAIAWESAPDGAGHGIALRFVRACTQPCRACLCGTTCTVVSCFRSARAAAIQWCDLGHMRVCVCRR